MNDELTNYFQRGERVRDFYAPRAADFRAGSVVADNIPLISSLLQRIQAADAVRSSGASKQSTVVKGMSVERLRDMVELMAGAARSMSVKTPGLNDKFRAPRGRGVTALLASARAFRTDATPIEAAFVRFGMDEDFLEELDDLIAAVEQSIAGANTTRTAKTESGADVEDLIDELNDTIREVIAPTRIRYRNDPATLAAWESAVHVKRAPKRDKTENPSKV